VPADEEEKEDEEEGCNLEAHSSKAVAHAQAKGLESQYYGARGSRAMRLCADLLHADATLQLPTAS
jgi:hypothetical protein